MVRLGEAIGPSGLRTDPFKEKKTGEGENGAKFKEDKILPRFGYGNSTGTKEYQRNEMKYLNKGCMEGKTTE